MRRIADLHEARACPAAIKDWKDTTKIGTAVRVVRSAERQKEEFGDLNGECLKRLTEEQRAIQALMQPDRPQAIAATAVNSLQAIKRVTPDSPKGRELVAACNAIASEMQYAVEENGVIIAKGKRDYVTGFADMRRLQHPGRKIHRHLHTG
jgi:hypothetical protein